MCSNVFAGKSCPDPICKGTNCWLVEQENGCQVCRCKSRCMPCPPMCQPENPLNECSGCICQINSTALCKQITTFKKIYLYSTLCSCLLRLSFNFDSAPIRALICILIYFVSRSTSTLHHLEFRSVFCSVFLSTSSFIQLRLCITSTSFLSLNLHRPPSPYLFSFLIYFVPVSISALFVYKLYL